jgi:hypothetical protein
MKLCKSVFIFFLMVLLLITAGCTSGDPAPEGESPDLNEAAPVYTETSLDIPPADTLEEQPVSSLIIGEWKIQTGNQEVLYWQFHPDGTLTGGNEPGSSRITGTWSSFGFEKYILIQAGGTTGNGTQIAYELAITGDPANGTISVDNPDKYISWEFTRHG